MSALRKRKRPISNVAWKVMMRERHEPGRRYFMRSSSVHAFSRYGLQQQLDTHDPSEESIKLAFLRRRSKIVEIVAASGRGSNFVYALTQTGVCAAFDRDLGRRHCFMNITPDEVIRSLFWNKTNQSLITVSVYRHDNFSSLKCRSTSIELIKRRQPEKGFALFETESLRWPGFVEFDDVNGKVLTYSAKNKIYKVWDLVNYNMLYEIEDKQIQEIKISPGIMLLIFQRSTSQQYVPLKILSIETGQVLKSFKHALHCERKIDFIEQFNEKLLVKQQDENLQIVDVTSNTITEVSRTDFMTPSAFIFLYENQLFLTFKGQGVAVWNFRGELVTKFEDHQLWHPDCNTNNIYITSQQDLIISYCRDHEQQRGSINVSNILTGKCLAKIHAGDGAGDVTHALEDVTALYYNEDRNEIYTGTKSGHLHVWSS